MNGNTDQILGQLNERTENLVSDIGEIKQLPKEHATRVDLRIAALELRNAEATGSWKAAGTVGAFAGGLGAFLYHLSTFFWPHS